MTPLPLPVIIMISLREKLEVEILNDAKTGIFGLVGFKKATILAKQASVKNFDFESKEEKAGTLQTFCQKR